jgi:hypothetical protein
MGCDLGGQGGGGEEGEGECEEEEIFHARSFGTALFGLRDCRAFALLVALMK